MTDRTAGGRAAVFFDRDGTLNVPPPRGGYILDERDLSLEHGAWDAVRKLRHAGYFLAVATNQRCVALGLLSEAQLGAIHERLQKLLRLQAGTALDAIYYCPDERGSPRRKPAPGMLLEAAAEHGLDLARSWMVGDSVRDVGAALNAGARPILIDHPGSGDPASELAADVRTKTIVVTTVLEAALVILEEDGFLPDGSPGLGGSC